MLPLPVMLSRLRLLPKPAYMLDSFSETLNISKRVARQSG